LDHLKWRETEQEVRDGSSGSDQAVEGDRDAELLNEDRTVQNGTQGDQVLLGTGERTSEFVSADMTSA
jgi:hypothetical protein